MSNMTPREIVHALDQHIVGQDAAKRAVAIALRNRWRRLRLDDDIRDEVTPKNILMIGPTGVGKTEIARRLARLAGAPFIKVEATKFTEVGYVGRDVESIARDLADVAVKMLRESQMEKVRHIGLFFVILGRYRAMMHSNRRTNDLRQPPGFEEQASDLHMVDSKLIALMLIELSSLFLVGCHHLIIGFGDTLV